MMRRKITVKHVDEDAWEMIADLREHERRFIGAIVGDAIRLYWSSIFEDAEPETPSACVII